MDEEKKQDVPQDNTEYGFKWSTDGFEHHYTAWDEFKDGIKNYFGDTAGKFLLILAIAGILLLIFAECVSPY